MIKTLRWLMRLLAPYRFRVILGSLLVALTVLGNVGLLATSGELLSEAALTPEVLLLMPLITGVRFFGISRAVVRYAERLDNHSVAFRILGHLRGDFYAHLEPLVPDAFPNYSQGKLYNQFVTDINVLQYFYLKAVSIPLGSIFIYTICAVFLAFFVPALVPLLLLGQLICGILVPGWLVAGSRKNKHDVQHIQTELSETFLEYKRGLLDLHIFGKLSEVQRNLKEKSWQFTLYCARQSLKKRVASRMTFALSHLTMLGALWLLTPYVENGELAGVHVAMLALLVLASFEAVLQMPEAALQMEESFAAAEDMRQVYEMSAPPKAEKTNVLDGWDICMENVAFSYHQPERRFIENLSLEIREGAHVAIVGESGSGKSSLARILSGLWHIDGGRLRVGGVELSRLDEDTLHATIACVEQESYFFYTSIRENMQLANPFVTDEAIWQALAMVELDEVVRTLPEALATVLAENAAMFSGGQRQRLAIARMIVQNPRIVILDEALQKLDKRLAERIFARLCTWDEGRTMIVISHSLALLDKLDFSYVFSYGKIIEQGTHQALLHQEDSHYRALYDIERSRL